MALRYVIMHKIVNMEKYTPVIQNNMWNVTAFAIEKMMMWESVRKECTQYEYMAKLVTASFLGTFNHRLAFYKNVMDNAFLYPAVKDLFSLLFCKMQRTYWLFLRLTLRWKWRRPRIQIHTDLYMNEIDRSHPHTYTLMQVGNVYLFTLSNLVNLITTAICHANHFCHEPLPIKNPYNNIAFSKTDLYNIYFRVRETYLKVPFFLRRFFECDFNIYQFKMECEKELREQAIKDYVNSADYRDVVADIETMIRKYDPNKYINISSGVGAKVIVDAFRPFLTTYYLSLFSFDRMQKSYCEMQLGRDLTKFIYTNYQFGQKTGRKIPSDNNPFILTRKPEYHLKWIRPSHVRLSVEHFMKSHLYDDRVFDRYIVQGDVNMAYVLPVRSMDLFVGTDGSSNPVLTESESEPDETHVASDSDEENAPVIAEEDALSEASDYQEEAEEDYDW